MHNLSTELQAGVVELKPESIEAAVDLLLEFNINTCDPYRVVREILSLAPRAYPRRLSY